jgi:hypothetical protein
MSEPTGDPIPDAEAESEVTESVGITWFVKVGLLFLLVAAVGVGLGIGLGVVPL